MSWVERLGKILSETVGVGEEGDCGAGVHNDMSTKSNNIRTCKIIATVRCMNRGIVTLTLG